MTKNPATDLRITARLSAADIALLRWAVRWRFFTMPQYVSSRGITMTAGYKRAARLRDMGMLAMARLAADQHAVHYPTPAAYAYLGSDHKPLVPTLGSLTHTLAVLDCGLRYEIRFPYGVVWTDREIQSGLYQATRKAHGGRNQLPPTAVPAGPWTRMLTGGFHAADIVLDVGAQAGGGGFHAVEVELARKGTGRLYGIMESFARDGRFASVTYVCSTQGMMQQVERVYDRLMVAYPKSRLELATMLYQAWHSVDPRN